MAGILKSEFYMNINFLYISSHYLLRGLGTAGGPQEPDKYVKFGLLTIDSS